MCTKKGKVKNLILVGNGFDLWQGLPTSYERFRQYYAEHIEEIMKRLKLKIRRIRKSDGTICYATPVELIYGEPFDPKMLPSEFFWSFEASLAQIDDQQINLYFGKSRWGLRRLRKTMEQAQKILQHTFASWIVSIHVDEVDSGYLLPEDCYCISFNYTDTLEKRFGVKDGNIHHIHGEADDPETIVVGHATHPELAFPELLKQRFMYKKNMRLKGLYLIEDALYRTDKHVQDNIDDLCEMMILDNVHIEDVENIYIVGHSFGEPDYAYFDFLRKVTVKDCEYNEMAAIEQLRKAASRLLEEEHLSEDIHLNIEYAIHHRERALGKKPLEFPEMDALDRMMSQILYGREQYYNDSEAKKAEEAVNRRFLIEQVQRTKEVLQEICALREIEEVPESAQCVSVFKLADYLDGGHEKRTCNAKWHISYRTPEDKARIESVMNRIGCDEYMLYPSIDLCLNRFKVS